MGVDKIWYGVTPPNMLNHAKLITNPFFIVTLSMNLPKLKNNFLKFFQMTLLKNLESFVSYNFSKLRKLKIITYN